MTGVNQVLPPVIDVVTKGTDWPAIIAAIVTGVAAVLGIGGTAWQAKRGREAASGDLQAGIGAADKRALQAEKLRVYSQFHGTLDEVVVRAVRSDARTTGKADLNNALTAMYRATAAVRLIAPERLGQAVRKAAEDVASETGTDRLGSREFDRDNYIYNQRQELYDKMRVDLGVEEEEAGAAPAAGQEG